MKRPRFKAIHIGIFQDLCQLLLQTARVIDSSRLTSTTCFTYKFYTIGCKNNL
jgi:hypothetical protein